jgi:hypothetical protein
LSKPISGGGNDVICSDDGDNRLDGERGNDLMNGGPGNDHFFEQAGGGTNISDFCTGTVRVIVFRDNSQPADDGLGSQDPF